MKKIFPLIPAVFLVFSCGFAFAETATHEHNHGHMAENIITIVNLESKPAVMKAGEPATLIFSLRDSEDRPLEDMSISHERILHIVIISADFNTFAHIHPEDFGAVTPDMLKKADFPVGFTFPTAGQYLIAADYAVKGNHLSEHFLVDVYDRPKMGSFKKDFSRKKKFGEYEVRLTTPDDIVPGREVTLSYLIIKGGAKVTDLEPYLSAPMHLAITSADLDNFIHAHGELPGTKPSESHSGHNHGAVPEKFGPVIEARVVFPVKGIYQIFSEIKHQGKVIPLSFMVEAE